MINVRLLGPLIIEIDGKAPRPELFRPMNTALFLYLALSGRRSRDQVIGLLWPDKPQSAAGRSLNVALNELRQYLGAGVVESKAGQIELSRAALHFDSDDLDSLPATADWRMVKPLIRGSFLLGWRSELSPVEDWLDTERRSRDRRSLAVLTRTAAREMDAGRLEEAAEAAGLACTIDPLFEAGIMALMRALTLAGDRTGALREYAAFVARVREELDAAPGAECQDLAERIRREPGRPPVRVVRPDERRRAPLVGREGALAQVAVAWQSARNERRAGAALLIGDMGTGKTRLGEEIAVRARLDGGTTVTIRAVESDRQTPWNGLLGLARGGLLDAPGLAGAPPAALHWFAERISEWAERFPAVRTATTDWPPVRAWSEILRATVSERPLLLRLDDAEVMDHESLLAIDAALRDLAGQPLFVLAAVTPESQRPEIDDFRASIERDVRGVVVRLGTLDLFDVRLIAQWAVPAYGDVQLDRLARRVHNDSAGIPLLAVELLSAVASGLDLELIKGDWPEPFKTLKQTLPGGLPEAVVSAVTANFRRRTLNAQRVLQAAAVLADRVTADLVTRTTSLPLAAVAEALDELEWTRWLIVDGLGYSFVAPIVRQVVDQQLVLEGHRRRLRAAAGLDSPPRA